MTTLNGKSLKDIAHTTSTATVVMTALALRARHRTNLDIDRLKKELLKQNEKIVDDEFYQFWKDLEEAGMGSVIHGRAGKPSVFRWHYSLRNVAKAAIEGSNVEDPSKRPIMVAGPVKKVIKRRGRPFGSKNKKSRGVVSSLTKGEIKLLKELLRKL